MSGVGRGEFEKEGKTIRELVKLYEGWIKTFRRGAENMDNRAYEKARVERPKFEEEKWIPLSKVAEAELQSSPKRRADALTAANEKRTPEEQAKRAYALKIALRDYCQGYCRGCPLSEDAHDGKDLCMRLTAILEGSE